MKRLLLTGVLATVALFAVNAQGIYFDIGFGFAPIVTSRIDGEVVSKPLADSGVSDFGTELGFKLGYGPIIGLPLYAVGGMRHMFSHASESIMFTSTLLSPGLIFYPIPLVQLAGSIGWSINQIRHPMPVYNEFESGSGWGFDVSAAIDLGPRENGLLIGLRYYGTYGKISGIDTSQTALSIFTRYAFRHKR